MSNNAKMGRPKKDELTKRSCKISLNFTPAEYEMIKQRADGINLSEFLRLFCLKALKNGG